MAAATAAQTLILFVAMGLVTIWFTNVILKALDILYKPKVKTWLGNRPQFGLDENENFCAVEAPGCNDHETSNSRTDTMTDEAIRQLEEELMVLKSLRGNMVKPSEKKKKKQQEKPYNGQKEDLPDLVSIKKRKRKDLTKLANKENLDLSPDRDKLAPDELEIISMNHDNPMGFDENNNMEVKLAKTCKIDGDVTNDDCVKTKESEIEIFKISSDKSQPSSASSDEFDAPKETFDDNDYVDYYIDDVVTVKDEIVENSDYGEFAKDEF